MKHLGSVAAAALLACVGVSAAQAPSAAPAQGAAPEAAPRAGGARGGIPPEMMERMRREEAAFRATPDLPGTGQYPAEKLEDPSLPAHTIYRPKDLSKLGSKKLGIVAWGNGGCSPDGAGQRLHLLELASHGYLVVANGGIMPAPPPGVAPTGAPRGGAPGGRQGPATRAEQMTETIDWAIGENERAGSPYRGKIDPSKIAVSGWSCGGVQALTIATVCTDSQWTYQHKNFWQSDRSWRRPR